MICSNLNNIGIYLHFQFSSVTQSCPTLCDPMNHSMPGLPVHHQLPESTQTLVHWVSDAIQPSHFLSSPFLLPSIFPSIRVFSNESTLHMRWPKYWSFVLPMNIGRTKNIQWISASVLPMNIQGWFPLGLTGLISLQSKGLSRIFSNSTAQKHMERVTYLWSDSPRGGSRGY